jgi:ABC-type branched-subunit amino acid transport system ATPase component
MIPELVSQLAEYRLLFVGVLLLAVLWLAPEGIIGTFARYFRRADPAAADAGPFDLPSFLSTGTGGEALVVRGIGISFGGVTAAADVSFIAEPRRITSVIGPNGAGKTSVLNVIGGFYRPDAGSIRLGGAELAGAPAWRIARAGIARTYQTTQLFGDTSVLDNILIALRRGYLGNPLVGAATLDDSKTAKSLLSFVGYHGPLAAMAHDLPHVDRRLVEIARALATRPRVLLLDEPAAGLMRSDKAALSKLIRCIADLGIAVILVEHDMALVMEISGRVVVLDAGSVIANGTPPDAARSRSGLSWRWRNPCAHAQRLGGSRDTVLSCLKLTAGYGTASVLDQVSFAVALGETVAMLGANGAGKSTAMRAVAGLLRPVTGAIVLDDERVDSMPAHRIAARGVALVPEGRQVFPELTVLDNILLGAHTRRKVDRERELAALLHRFPRLRERLTSRAGLLSGGEQQMLAIARGLMAKPRILLLDEPSLGLAPAMIRSCSTCLPSCGRRHHNPAGRSNGALALAVADRGYVLESGHIVRHDTADALVRDPALEAAYLGRAEATLYHGA